jgi:hypothetical protein
MTLTNPAFFAAFICAAVVAPAKFQLIEIADAFNEIFELELLHSIGPNVLSLLVMDAGTKAPDRSVSDDIVMSATWRSAVQNAPAVPEIVNVPLAGAAVAVIAINDNKVKTLEPTTNLSLLVIFMLPPSALQQY